VHSPAPLPPRPGRRSREHFGFSPDERIHIEIIIEFDGKP
jgi:hypothetical protein